MAKSDSILTWLMSQRLGHKSCLESEGSEDWNDMELVTLTTDSLSGVVNLTSWVEEGGSG